MAKKNASAKTPAPPRRRKPAARNGSDRLECGPDELIVRMYRQGLGDCFLLALPGDDGKTKYVLIDCGVHARQTDGPARLLQVMTHLKNSTGGRLDVVIATHEHADHLSGFVQKNSPFLGSDTEVRELWLAWTERRGDPQADRLRRKRGTAQRLIDKAVEEAQGRLGASGAALAERLRNLTDFIDPAPASTDFEAARAAIEKGGTAVDFLEPAAGGGVSLGAAKTKKPRASSNELAIGLLATKAGESQTAYCEPGDVREVAGVSDLRVYVLGPPRSELLEKDKPTKIRGADEHTAGGAYKEVYLASSRSNRALELSPTLGVEAASSSGSMPEDWRYPFAAPFRRKCAPSLPIGFGREHCWQDEETEPPAATRAFFESTYLADEHRWRRIDGDWLGSAESVALNLDSDTNNTSLALAFECGPVGSGTVLLFAADAQVGNWLSWRDQVYGPRRLTAEDLLSRVSVYKVGHHGSHNATVRRDPRVASPRDVHGAPFGLEVMRNIIALVPVDEEAVRKKMPNPWKMPHEPLYVRLREKAARRVLRSDLSMAPLDARLAEDDVVPKSEKWQAVPGFKGARWRCSSEDFDTGTEGPLCYDISIPLGG